jgi:hypothetical protein
VKPNSSSVLVPTSELHLQTNVAMAYFKMGKFEDTVAHSCAVSTVAHSW